MQSQQISDLFVGRREEIALFENWLADDHSPASVLYLHDEAEEPEKKGGVGKTWLLKEFARRARESRPDLVIVNIDFFNVVDRDRVVIATRIVHVLSEAFPDWAPEAFSKALAGNVTSDFSSEKYSDVRSRDGLFNALALDLQTLEKNLASTGTYLLLFFDTFEAIEDNPVIAVLGGNRTFPDMYASRRIKAVVAGRNALNWSHPNWVRRESEVRDVALAPFDPQEMLDYIDARLLSEQTFAQKEAQDLYKLTFGRPILIGLVTDVLNHRIMSLEQLLAVPHEQFEERLVAQINRLEDPLNWVILFMGHVYHRFTMETLSWIIQKTHIKDTENINYAQLIQQLPNLSFVRRSGAGEHFVLHDEMRRLVTRYCWEVQDRNRSIRKEISHCIVDYCDQQLDDQKVSDAENQLYTVMKLYHLLFSDVNEGHKYFRVVLYEAASRQLRSAFARSLMQETRPFTAEFSARQISEQVYAGALVLWSEGNPKSALAEHERLKQESSAEWYAEQEEEILIARGRCYLDLSQLAEASECFTRALMLGNEARRAFLLDLLGFVHRRRGELDRAKQYYNEGKEAARVSGNNVQYANTLNNLSNVLRLQGQIEEALRICKFALKLRRKLVQERKASGKAVALSLNTLGLIYIDSENYGLAEQALKEAVEISIHVKDVRNIGMGKVRLGRIYLARGELEQAKMLLEEAERLSMDLYPEVLIASLNRQARVYLRQENWQKAQALFQRALEAADQARDYYQRVECLIDYAIVLEHMNYKEKAQQMWRDVQSIAERENYHYLQYRAERARGDIFMNASEYVTAFQYYARSCQFAVKHNQLSYNNAVRAVGDRLLEIPASIALEILTFLITFWAELGNATAYPELINSCEEMRQLMSL